MVYWNLAYHKRNTRHNLFLAQLQIFLVLLNSKVLDYVFLDYLFEATINI